MACETSKYVGRDVPMEFFIGCGDLMPEEADWVPIGALRSKEASVEWDTVDATADDTVGAIREMLATYKTYTISADGVCKRADGTESNQTLLYKHVLDPIATGGQPVAWVRITYPDVTVVCLMLFSTMSRSVPYDEVATFSVEATSTVSDFGIVVTDTPVVP